MKDDILADVCRTARQRQAGAPATSRGHEIWPTNITELRVVGWGWYYLSAVLDDDSRNLIAWKLSATMSATDVAETLDRVIAVSGVDEAPVRHRPRLLSDNGRARLSGELRDDLGERGVGYTRGRPYPPLTQGKIERYHRSMKAVITLEHYDFPWQREAAIREFVRQYNNERHHESLDNVTPADVILWSAP